MNRNCECSNCHGWQECEPLGGLEAENARLEALMKDVLPIIDEALNYFYPSRKEDGDAAMNARASLFDLREKLQILNEANNTCKKQ